MCVKVVGVDMSIVIVEHTVLSVGVERIKYCDDASRNLDEVKKKVKEEDEKCNKEVPVVKPVYTKDDFGKEIAEPRELR